MFCEYDTEAFFKFLQTYMSEIILFPKLYSSFHVVIEFKYKNIIYVYILDIKSCLRHEGNCVIWTEIQR